MDWQNNRNYSLAIRRARPAAKRVKTFEFALFVLHFSVFVV